MPPQSISEEELDALPELSDDELEALPVIDETATSEDTLTDGGTGLGLGTITRGLSRIPKVGMERLRGFMSLFSDPGAAVNSLLGKGGTLGMPSPIGDMSGAPFGVQVAGNLAREALERPGVTQTVLGAGGAIAGLPLAPLGIGPTIGGTIGAEAGNQLNQFLGTSPDTPIGDDLEKAIAGGSLDLATAGAAGLAAKGGLLPARLAKTDADTTGIIGAKLGANNGTVARRLVLGEDLARAESTIQKLDPFKGVNPSDPKAFDKITEQMSTIKESNIQAKQSLLQRADDSGLTIDVTPGDVDSLVASLRSQNINVADDVVEYARAKLARDLKVEGEWRPGMTSELRDNRLVGVSNKSLSATEAQEFIRRNVDDELSKLGYYDNGTYANLLLDEKAMANMRLQTQGLSLVRKVMDKKLQDSIGSIDPKAAQLLGETNTNISALIDYEPAIRMAWASRQGALGVPHGASLIGSTGMPGKLGQLVNAIEPNFIANALRTRRGMKMQEQMLGPIQRVISMRQGGAGPLGSGLSQLLGSAGGDIAGMAMAIQLIPRSAEALQQDPQQAATILSREAYKQALKMTGSEEAAASVAQRTGADAMKAASSGSPEEMKAFIGAASKALPGAFQPGEYPDEVDGTVYDPRSKMQMEDNAKLHLSQGTVDSIAYAKQKQEAWRNGPSKIVIHKDGQISPDLVPPPQEVPVDDAAIFADSNQTNY